MMGRPPTRIDILTDLVGVEFVSAWSRATITEFAPGCRCRVNGIDDLIANKQAAGRPQDLADVEALEHLQRLRSQQG
jgi:hypothetical protein